MIQDIPPYGKVALQGMFGNAKDLVKVKLPDVAGNATTSWTPDKDFMYVILNLTYGFTSDANAANRQPSHFIQPMTSNYSATFVRLALADAITASQFYNAYFHLFAGSVPYIRNAQSANAFHAFGSLPFVPITSQGRLVVGCTGGLAGDAISSIYADVLIYDKK